MHNWRLTIFVGIIGKVIATIANLMQVPMASEYLGADNYSAWVIIVSTIPVLSLLDFGIGYSIQNRLTIARTNNNHETETEIIINGLTIFVCLATIFGITLITFNKQLLAAMMGLARIQNNYETQAALRVCIIIVCVTFPASIYPRYLIAIHQMWLVGIFQSIASAIMIVAIYTATITKLSFTTFTAITVLSALIPNLFSAIYVHSKFGLRLPLSLKPPLFSELKSLTVEGSGYILPQMANAVINFIPGVIILQNAGPSGVFEMNVFQRIQNAIIQIQSLILNPLWPIYGSLSAKNNISQAGSILKQSIFFSVFYGIAVALSLVWCGPKFLVYWLGDQAQVIERKTILVFSIYLACLLSIVPISIFLNGVRQTKSQSIGGILTAISLIFVSPVLTRHYGVAGFLIGITICSASFGWFAQIIEVALTLPRKHINRKTKQDQQLI